MRGRQAVDLTHASGWVVDKPFRHVLLEVAARHDQLRQRQRAGGVQPKISVARYAAVRGALGEQLAVRDVH